jgi:cytosine/adenosine deaminase-related metal-dependent hydrolase
MMAAGINVCLGTDSLASNQSLSIMDEWRYLHQAYPELDLPTLVRMSTMNAATALGLDVIVGSLEPGKLADFIVLPVTDSSMQGAMEEVLSRPVEPTVVCIGGNAMPIEEVSS